MSVLCSGSTPSPAAAVPTAMASGSSGGGGGGGVRGTSSTANKNISGSSSSAAGGSGRGDAVPMPVPMPVPVAVAVAVPVTVAVPVASCSSAAADGSSSAPAAREVPDGRACGGYGVRSQRCEQRLGREERHGAEGCPEFVQGQHCSRHRRQVHARRCHCSSERHEGVEGGRALAGPPGGAQDVRARAHNGGHPRRAHAREVPLACRYSCEGHSRSRAGGRAQQHRACGHKEARERLEEGRAQERVLGELAEDDRRCERKSAQESANYARPRDKRSSVSCRCVCPRDPRCDEAAVPR